MPLLPLVLAMMTTLSPTNHPLARHRCLAEAIARVAEESDPLFGDEDRRFTAALLVAVAFRESSLTNDIADDTGAVCAFQIQGGSPALRKDPLACARRAMAMLRESAEKDPAHPVAFYARGPRYQSPEARRISRDRVDLALLLAGVVRP